MTIDRVGIVGLGLIGGSIGAALRARGVHVTGMDADSHRTERAVTLGLIDEPADSLPGITSADAVVLATPLATILRLLAPVDAAADPQILLIDTGSVKAPVLDAMNALAGAHRAVGGHPIAGKETSGPDAADRELFVGRPFALVPTASTTVATMGTAEALIRLLGAHPIRLEAQRHDAVLARTSHLPQILSTLLALSLASGDADLSGPALRDMTRLAASDAVMWRDILVHNRGPILDALQLYRSHMDELTSLIEAGDAEGLESLLREADAAGRPAPGVPV